jgi:hypothetical protein
VKKVMFNGVSPKGTLRPRRLWSPGDALDVADDVAGELLGETGFVLLKEPDKVKPRKRRGG